MRLRHFKIQNTKIQNTKIQNTKYKNTKIQKIQNSNHISKKQKDWWFNWTPLNTSLLDITCPVIQPSNCPLCNFAICWTRTRVRDKLHSCTRQAQAKDWQNLMACEVFSESGSISIHFTFLCFPHKLLNINRIRLIVCFFTKFDIFYTTKMINYSSVSLIDLLISSWWFNLMNMFASVSGLLNTVRSSANKVCHRISFRFNRHPLAVRGN